MPVAGHAIELTGGTADLSYSEFTQYPSSNSLAAQGSIEIGFSREFEMQADVGSYNIDQSLATGSNATLHAVYNYDQNASFGAFYGQDQISGVSENFYGIEAGQKYGNLGLEGFTEFSTSSGVSDTALGLSGKYMAMPNLSVGLALQYDTSSVATLTVLRARTEYTLAPGAKLYAEIGTVSGDVFGYSIGNNDFVGVGGRFAFGPKNGVSFGHRGFLAFVPGL